MPEAEIVGSAQRLQVGVGHALPVAEMLLRQRAGDDRRRHGRRDARREDGGRGLMRALEVRHQPHGIVRQQAGEMLELGLVGAVGFDIVLAIDAAIDADHRRMAHQPPAGHGMGHAKPGVT